VTDFVAYSAALLALGLLLGDAWARWRIRRTARRDLDPTLELAGHIAEALLRKREERLIEFDFPTSLTLEQGRERIGIGTGA
jgi:hypothetical protein